MSAGSAYREALLDHYRYPRNRTDTRDAQITARGRNPRCGDDLEIGVDVDEDVLVRVCFRGRGCSICIASASMMTEAATGQRRAAAAALRERLFRWFGGEPTAQAGLPDVLQPLAPLRDMPARHRCVLLAWEALGDALDQTGGRA